jgi:hypothetical protein
MMKWIPKIVSGGQTGADRAALDWALARNLPCGRWCPKGRRAEDGPIDARYPLQESRSPAYIQRTEWNVRDSDVTVLFSIAPILTGGSKKTAEFASQHHKPCIHIHERMLDGPQRLKEFLEANEVRTLNVAGPRASNEPQVGQFVFATLDRVFGSLMGRDEGEPAHSKECGG